MATPKDAGSEERPPSAAAAAADEEEEEEAKEEQVKEEQVKEEQVKEEEEEDDDDEEDDDEEVKEEEIKEEVKETINSGSGSGSESMTDERVVVVDDGLRYDLELMESDPLLDQLKEWDYPIFDLLDQYNQRILSTVSCFIH